MLFRSPPQPRPRPRGFSAAMKRYNKGEAYRKVAASGGGAREVARRAKQAQFENVRIDAKVEDMLGKSHSARLAAS